ASARAFTHNGLYGAKVTRQELTKSKAGDPQLRLTVKLASKFKNGWRPSGGSDPLAPQLQQEKLLFITFSPGNFERLSRTFADLKSYGFSPHAERGLLDLHPEQDPETRFDFTGKDVAVLCRYSPAAKNPGQDRDWWDLKAMKDS